MLLVPVDDATPGEVVGGELDDHSVRREDADVAVSYTHLTLPTILLV